MQNKISVDYIMEDSDLLITLELARRLSMVTILSQHYPPCLGPSEPCCAWGRLPANEGEEYSVGTSLLYRGPRLLSPPSLCLSLAGLCL